MPRVRIHADFRADQSAHFAWLVDLGEPSWIETLIAGTRWIVRTLARFPRIGPVRATDGTLTLRSIRYPKGPYLAWYVLDESALGADVIIVRLFHVRQELPEPDVARWDPATPEILPH